MKKKIELDNGEFFIVTSKTKPGQDSFHMWVTNKKGVISQVLGSHPSLKGTLAFLKNNQEEIISEVDKSSNEDLFIYEITALSFSDYLKDFELYVVPHKDGVEVVMSIDKSRLGMRNNFDKIYKNLTKLDKALSVKISKLEKTDSIIVSLVLETDNKDSVIKQIKRSIGK